MIEDRVFIAANEMSLYYFDKYYKAHSKYPLGKSYYQKTFKEKYFKYFEKASMMFCIRDEFNPNNFIDCCMADGFKYPAQIPLESNWNKFSIYKIGIKSKEKEIAERIVSGALEIKKLGSIDRLIELNENQLFQNKTRFDPLILYFSKTFINFYEENLNKFNYKINFGIKRYPVLEYTKIVNKIHQILNDDYFSS